MAVVNSLDIKWEDRLVLMTLISGKDRENCLLT